jgi:hypothetical protein
MTKGMAKAIAQQNYSAAIDQAQVYGSLERALWAYSTNVEDTISEENGTEHWEYANDLFWAYVWNRFGYEVTEDERRICRDPETGETFEI